MNTIRGLLGVAVLAVLWTGPAWAADVDGDKALAQNAINWLNRAGRAWAPGKWVDVTLLVEIPTLAWQASEVVYGPQSALGPPMPTGLESLMGVNCGAPGSEPIMADMNFAKQVTKISSTTVTQGVSVAETIGFMASVPSWGTGVNESTTVTYSTSTASTATDQVAYTYSFTVRIKIDPGLKVTATMVVDFQDAVVPWSASLLYVGKDTAADVADWAGGWFREPNPTQYGLHWSSDSTPLASLLTDGEKRFAVTGEFKGVAAGSARVVQEPAEMLTPQDRAEYCQPSSPNSQEIGTNVFIVPTYPAH